MDTYNETSDNAHEILPAAPEPQSVPMPTPELLSRYDQAQGALRETLWRELQQRIRF